MANKGSIKKAQYYVEYLGWKESTGLYGREFTEPIVRELLARRRLDYLPRLTIQVSSKEIKVTQEIRNRKGKTEKKKFPPIPAKDVTYAIQALHPDMDVVACIFLGFNQYTGCAVHSHVYRCDSEETAGVFVRHLNQLIESPENQTRILDIERELAQEGHVLTRMNNPTEPLTKPYIENSDSGRGSHEDSRELSRLSPGPNMETTAPMWNSITSELQQKLNLKDKQPLLLPPKDYDTVCRRHGKLDDVKFRRSLQLNIVGPNIFEAPQNGELEALEEKANSDNTGSSNDLPSPTNSSDDDPWKRSSQPPSVGGLQRSASDNDPYRNHRRRPSSSGMSIDSFHSDGMDYNSNSRKKSDSGPYPYVDLKSPRGRLSTDEGYTSEEHYTGYNPMFSPNFHGDTIRRKLSGRHHRRSVTGPGGLAETFDEYDDPLSRTTPASGFSYQRRTNGHGDQTDSMYRYERNSQKRLPRSPESRHPPMADYNYQ